MLIGLVKTLRPKQWIKNIFVFAALVFDSKLLMPEPFLRTLAGFFLLCMTSGTVYLINDLADIEKDRQHPKKRLRPLPSGKLSKGVAVAAAILLPLVTLPAAFLLDPVFAIVLILYLLMQIAYSFRLKNIVIIDVMVIAAGFLLRVAAGIPLVDAERFSPWLYICMTLLALLIGFGKRRHELVLLSDQADQHRQSLQEYNLSLLDHIISIVTASILIAYSLYTFHAPNPNLPEYREFPLMMLSIPFLLYAIFRYLYLIHVKGLGGAPEEIVLSDRPLQVSVFLWGLCAVIVMYALPWIVQNGQAP